MPTTGTRTADVVLRPRRQITLPQEICDQLGLQIGDRLELLVEANTLVARPKKALALEALREIQRAFQASGLTETQLQEAGRRLRERLFKEGHAQG